MRNQRYETLAVSVELFRRRRIFEHCLKTNLINSNEGVMTRGGGARKSW